MHTIAMILIVYFLIGIAAFATILIMEMKQVKKMAIKENSMKITLSILFLVCTLFWPSLLKEELFGKK
jgi:hypothetical protein